MNSQEIQVFKSGVHNLLSSEIIPKDASSDSANWITIDGRIVLSGGRSVVHSEGLVGNNTGEIFGYRVDGSKVHYRKVGTKIQYDNGTTWVDVVTGLTADYDYAFTNYQSLAGAFTYFWGIDGIYKVNNANPASAFNMYDAAKNFKGRAFIDKGRAILWARPEDPTGLYGSWIDRQNGTNYTTVANETLATANGVLTSFSGTLGVYSTAGNGVADSFGVTINAQTGTKLTITNITQGFQANVTTSTPHGLIVGDKVVFQGIGGMTQMNGLYGTVVGTPSGSIFLVDINSTSFTAYTAGGNVAKGQQFKDNFLGVLKNQSGGLDGTINYTTGAWSVSFAVAPLNTDLIVANYQWQNSNNHGVTDFTHSATRVAGEGFQFPQDEGGDPIMNVLIGTDGYYSLKQHSAYLLTIGDDDLTATNIVYRKQMGVPSYRAGTVITQGIIFMNTSNPEKPILTLLQKNIVGSTVDPVVLFPQFDFSLYNYDDCAFGTNDVYVTIACKSEGSATNNTILLCNVADKTVDITNYNVRVFANNDGLLYGGSSLTQSTYLLYDGFDDDGFTIENYWNSKDEAWGSSRLKKNRFLRLKGRISKDQSYAVYVNYDDAGYQLVGTVLGNADYVDYSSSQTVGSNIIGTSVVGGSMGIDTYQYFLQIRLKKIPKYRKRMIQFVALGIGYVDIDTVIDGDIMLFENKIPPRFRQKQNVSLDGTEDNLPHPEF